MAISKSIVEMMGGTIQVESEKGLGSTFTVTVTLGRGHESQHAKALAGGEDALSTSEETAPASASVEGRHVLIAEDQEINAEILCELLEMEGVSSEWARNGLQALQMFEQSEEGHFDAILMGMRMPEMDGLAATQKIRKLNRPDATTIPIIALTANAFEEDVKSCLSAGMNAHMSKPVDIDLLIRKLTELTSS